MVPGRPPDVLCLPLASFDPADLRAVTTAFAEAAALDLQQAWLARPTPAFAAGRVRVGWRDGDVLVFATLVDADVRTRVTEHNQRFWELGDTFEIFLRPLDQAAYVEFHVAPNNCRLQLRFESDAWLSAEPRVDPFADALRGAPLFRSHTWTDDRGWHVLAAIPRASVCDAAGSLTGATWLASFSRYDVTGHEGVPVISSTSPHPVAAFHRQQEWARLTFVSPGQE